MTVLAALFYIPKLPFYTLQNMAVCATVKLKQPHFALWQHELRRFLKQLQT